MASSFLYLLLGFLLFLFLLLLLLFSPSLACNISLNVTISPGFLWCPSLVLLFSYYLPFLGGFWCDHSLPPCWLVLLGSFFFPWHLYLLCVSCNLSLLLLGLTRVHPSGGPGSLLGFCFLPCSYLFLQGCLFLQFFPILSSPLLQVLFSQSGCQPR